MFRTVLISLIILLGCNAFGQDSIYRELEESELKLGILFDSLYSETAPDKETILDQILGTMDSVLSSDLAMEFSWSGLNRIGVITSEDRKLRTFTWHVEDDPDTYRYYGFIQVAQKRGKVKVYPLLDNGKLQRNVYNLDQAPGNWYGKLYYSIVPTSVKRKTYYALLGMDFNDSRSTIKSIEVVMIQRNQPVFMKQMFYNGRDRVDRVVLEYSDKVAISVRYDPNLGMIVFDHLVPFHSIYKNSFEFYGPDGSYDGLEFINGSWIFREDIDARLQY